MLLIHELFNVNFEKYNIFSIVRNVSFLIWSFLFYCTYIFFSQRGYRVKLDEQKYTVPVDRVDLACAKNAAEVLNEVRLRSDR